jgi:hypothetical protein
VTADGSFAFSIKRRNSKTYFSPDVRIVQHDRSISTLVRIRAILGGNIHAQKDGTSVVRINDSKHILRVVLPFFDSYSLHGNKLMDFNDFRRGMMMIQAGEH